MNRQLADKYFDKHCTAQEAKAVLKWFDTAEGQAYLEERLESDIHLAQKNEILPLINNETSEEIWQNIEKKLDDEKPANHAYFQQKSNGNRGWYVSAAIMLVLITTSLLLTLYLDMNQEAAESEQLLFQTTSDEFRKITLKDGTVIQLNINSTIRVPGNYGDENRKVWLTGEAYFDVADKKQSFIVQTEQTVIEDLGTAFNVRALEDGNDVNIAVTEGEVMFWNKQYQDQQKTHLTEGQFASYDITNNSIRLSQVNVENYLVWFRGRLKFNNTSLSDVSKQLEEIYDIQISFEDQNLKTKRLTADFSCTSATKALDAITITLGLEYTMTDKQVTITG